MDLKLDTDAFENASRDFQEDCDRLKTLRKNIEECFQPLKADWDSDAGQKFFEKLSSDLLENLDLYSVVFEYISRNLTTASQKYEEVFRAADTVAQAEY